MTINKLGFDVLSLQVTRRCNLSCKHCCCGEAEDADMTKETIDNILNETFDIGVLMITGGEPLLNDEIIKYTFDEIIRRNIRCFSFSMHTNGIILKKDFCDKLNDFAQYCRQYNTNENIITLGISGDKYHDNDPLDALKFYKKNVYGRSYIFIDTEADGMLLKVGKANDLEDDEMYESPNYTGRAIVLLEYDKKSTCLASKYEVKREDQAIVLCPALVTVTGNICSNGLRNFSLEDEPVNIAGNVNDKTSSIYSKIKSFNKGKPNCFGILDDSSQVSFLQLYNNNFPEFLNTALKYQNVRKDVDKRNKAILEMLEFEGLEDMHSQYPKLTRKECIILKNSLKHVSEEYLGQDIINRHRTIISDLEKANKQRSGGFGNLLDEILS